jgi:hypothetical protein
VFFVFCDILIVMGRKRIYQTKEEIIAIRRKWALDYYYRNQERCKQKRMARYYAETKQK